MILLAIAAIAFSIPSVAAAEQILRVATWHTVLSRDGPGLLLRDILSEDDPQIVSAHDVIATVSPDILLLTGIDTDPGGATLAALQQALAKNGAPYAHGFSLPSNAGLPTALDLDGDGRTGTARDAQGYGRFTGDGAMALLSRLPIDKTGVADLSPMLWRDLPDATLPTTEDGSPFPSIEAQSVQRLSSTGHWVVPVALGDGTKLSLLAYSATPPVFDGPEDRNGLRNADETALWRHLLDGALPPHAVPERFVILGRSNLDPADGDGRLVAMRDLLGHAALQDPMPRSTGPAPSPDAAHRGDPAQDTADWRSVSEGGPGNLRVDYVLPSATLKVRDAGVHWPIPVTEEAGSSGRSGLVWVDVVLP